MITKYIKRLCCEDPSLIENYDKAIADEEVMWHVHHRKEISEDGHIFYLAKELIEKGEYYNRPASELIFLTPEAHRALHWQEEQKRLVGDAQVRSWTEVRKMKTNKMWRKKRDRGENLVNIPQLESDKDYRDYQRVYKTHWYDNHREEWNEYNYRYRLSRYSDDKLARMIAKHTNSMVIAEETGRYERAEFLKTRIQYISEELEKRNNAER